MQSDINEVLSALAKLEKGIERQAIAPVDARTGIEMSGQWLRLEAQLELSIRFSP